MALFGQPVTQAGAPQPFSRHSSHFCIVPFSPGASAPYGQTSTQVRQPTHRSRSTRMTPSRLDSAPAMQLFTQMGSVQWRQETA